jgi:hypothetical protein
MRGRLPGIATQQRPEESALGRGRPPETGASEGFPFAASEACRVFLSSTNVTKARLGSNPYCVGHLCSGQLGAVYSPCVVNPANITADAGQDAGDDEALAALERLVSVTAGVLATLELVAERARFIAARRLEGLPWGEIIPIEQRPLVVELTADAMQRLAEASADFRRSEARALYAEGHTMDAIAVMFGVTRQRVSSLLRCD